MEEETSERKIALFVYCPAMTFNAGEFEKRVSTFCNMEISQHFIHWEAYRGGGDSLGPFQTFLRRIKGRKPVSIVLLLTCHGRWSENLAKMGDFRDEHLRTVAEGMPPFKTANDFAATVASYHAEIAESPLREVPFTVVCAQCYGAHFADRVRDIIVGWKLNVSVVGLSYGKTHRDYVQGYVEGTQSTIGRIQVHREFYAWLCDYLGIAEVESDDQDSDTNDL